MLKRCDDQLHSSYIQLFQKTLSKKRSKHKATPQSSKGSFTRHRRSFLNGAGIVSSFKKYGLFASLLTTLFEIAVYLIKVNCFLTNPCLRFCRICSDIILLLHCPDLDLRVNR